MDLSNTSNNIDYKEEIDGTWGHFSTSAGRVAFLMTKARLGESATDNERRLTSKLKPVREILNVEQLDFNQLLQRDLDDHRVATELIPYVLESQDTGPAYFPPLIAVLLPFNGNTPVEHQSEPESVEDKKEDGVLYGVKRYGEAFQVQRAVQTSGEYHDLKLGKLRWNDEKSKLVVIDGQHRAMALLAIDRTINGTWGEGGEKYKYFYEHRVNRILSDKNINLDRLEFPVNICWFPDASNGTDPHKAARKLFVDLNREARQPSEARLILLSDQKLKNIFSRAVLNRLREDDCDVPVYAVEYDNPSDSSYRPTRWSVATNLHSIKYAIQYGPFCPDRYLSDLTARFGGRLPENEMDERMRDQLDVTNMMPEVIDDEKEDRMIRRANIGDDYFPREKLPALKENFMEGWGKSIIEIFSSVTPYKAHCDALTELKESWAAEGSIASLAYESLFSGMGMYWTLRDSHKHWKDRKRELKRMGEQVPETPDVVGAWDVLKEKKDDFERIRSKKYFDSEGKKAIEKSNAVYSVLNTHACQIGAILTLATIADTAGVKGDELFGLTKDVCKSWSEAFESNVVKTRDRRAIFVKDDDLISNPVNRVSKMDTPIAVHFRYFWLELLALDNIVESVSEKLEASHILSLRDEARTNYFDYLIKEQKKAITKTDPEIDDREAWKKAEEEERKIFSKSLDFWYEVPEESFDEWYNSTWDDYTN
ncbi:hypothetical protein GGP84_003028 [Salinibacter ruber]|uniref:DNA sulfur modification protein DndB n=1 Tax=Salinibacter ruber TaxID=146919 RepID=UPI002168631B|nr:DNA sulfur modification protein DndB [Salinibacter ruber]MCS3940376.1 hypothetical protein [Salinibacter ruber]